MNKSDIKHQQLIQELTSDIDNHQPRILSIPSLMAIWFIVCFLLTAIIMYWIEPFRENFIQQIFESPLFMSETIFGFIAIILLACCAFYSSIPGLSYNFRWVAITSFFVWIGIIVSGLSEPVLPGSMVGKRDLCFLEIMLYGIPLAGFMTFFVYRRYTTKPIISAVFIAVSSMFIPAFIMQYACMYEAHHNLLFHLLPATIMSLVLMPVLIMILSRRLK